MNKIFLSKDNTSKLYKEILKENNLQALPRKSKEIIVDNLVSNMKEVYRHIDKNKINNSNISGILGQFNNMCVNETTKQLKGSDIFSGEDTQVSRLKFARDFKSTPQKKVQFLEDKIVLFGIKPTYPRAEKAKEITLADPAPNLAILEKVPFAVISNLFKPLSVCFRAFS